MPRIVKNIPLMDLTAFLIESVDSPAHVGLLQVFEPVEESSADIIARVLRAYREGDVAPPFNYYPVFPRFGMPKWAEAESFATDYHIRHAAVPPPGTQKQLTDLAMDLHAGMMDRSRPGWIAYVIEGLEDDCFAIYWKVHHAYIDGTSAVMRLDASMSKSAQELAVLPLWGPLFDQPETSQRDISLADLVSESGLSIGAQAKTLREIALSIGRSVKQARGQIKRESPIPFSAPRSMFNQPVHATRNLGTGMAQLSRFKKLARAEEVSINDIALTIVGSALDRYSEKLDRPTDKQLVAACPMAVRKEGDTGASTQISAISVKLGNADMSIYERLQQVHASSTDAKREAQQMSREALMNYLILVGGAATIFSKTPLADVIPPLTSVNVSNVAGPRERRYLSGAELIRTYPLSTLAGGTAINITFTSFSGRMEYAVVADATAVPNAQEIADFMLDSLNELEIAILGRARRSPKKKSPPGMKPKAKRKMTLESEQE